MNLFLDAVMSMSTKLLAIFNCSSTLKPLFTPFIVSKNRESSTLRTINNNIIANTGTIHTSTTNANATSTNTIQYECNPQILSNIYTIQTNDIQYKYAIATNYCSSNAQNAMIDSTLDHSNFFAISVLCYPIQ